MPVAGAVHCISSGHSGRPQRTFWPVEFNPCYLRSTDSAKELTPLKVSKQPIRSLKTAVDTAICFVFSKMRHQIEISESCPIIASYLDRGRLNSCDMVTFIL